jgi:hypothetical protein
MPAPLDEGAALGALAVLAMAWTSQSGGGPALLASVAWLGPLAAIDWMSAELGAPPSMACALGAASVAGVTTGWSDWSRSIVMRMSGWGSC